MCITYVSGAYRSQKKATNPLNIVIDRCESPVYVGN